MKIERIETIPVTIPIERNVVIRSSMGVHDCSRLVLVAHFACFTPAVDSESNGADIVGPLYHPEDVIAGPIEIHGAVTAPKGPGLGVERDEVRIARFRAL